MWGSFSAIPALHASVNVYKCFHFPANGRLQLHAIRAYSYRHCQWKLCSVKHSSAFSERQPALSGPNLILFYSGISDYAESKTLYASEFYLEDTQLGFQAGSSKSWWTCLVFSSSPTRECNERGRSIYRPWTFSSKSLSIQEH